jgi:alpha-L-rhamnosidase
MKETHNMKITNAIARTSLVAIACTAIAMSSIPAVAANDVMNLRCEYRENPLGIEAAKPRLSWKIKA